MQQQETRTHSPNKPRIADTLLYLVTNYDDEPALTRTKLVKLTYLADKRHYASHDRSLTGVRYLKYAYGPSSGTLVDAVENLENDDQIHVETHTTDSRQQNHHEPCCMHCQTDPFDSLTSTHIETLDAVLDEYASLATTAIVESICTSGPVNSLDKYTPVPLE